jgi:hypothetical protein
MTRKALAVKVLVWLSAVIAILGVGFCLIYQARHPATNYVDTRRQKQNEASQRGDNAAAIQETAREPHNKTANNEFSNAGNWTDPIVLLTALLVAGVIVTNIIYYGQLKKMRDTVRIVGEQGETMKGHWETMKAQVEVAGKQADLASRQVDLMVQNERARMGVRALKPIGLDGQRRLAVQVTFRNGGKSAAFGFRDYATVKVLNAGEMPPEFEWTDITPIFRRSFIPAGEDRSTIVDFFGLEDPEDIADGRKVLFVDGKARYSILGGENKTLCFGGTYRPGDGQFEIRYHYEREDNGEETKPN